MDECGQKVQTCSNKTKSPRDVMYRRETIVDKTVLHIWKLLKE